MISHPDIKVRSFEDADWPQLWAVLEPILRAGDTYAVPHDVSESSARQKWPGAPNSVFVAEDSARGVIVGSYYIRPNHDGPGSHVCNCGYSVSPASRGQGIASILCEHSQYRASESGFSAMQFNLVASSNEGAVRPWVKHGFEIIGTLPGAFRHPNLGFVDAYVMFKPLPPAA